MTHDYPDWFYYPARVRPRAWVYDFVAVVRTVRAALDSMAVSGPKAMSPYQKLRPGLDALGYRVQSGKTAGSRIPLPVLFGESRVARVTQEVDAFHRELGVLVEVEAGRGARGNAIKP